MRFGDKVGIEMNDAKGNSIFGRIENTVEKYEGPQKNSEKNSEKDSQKDRVQSA